jgi:NH3-dependent NAD+ synthetase
MMSESKEPPKQYDALVIPISGGVDSATALLWAKKKYPAAKLVPLYIPIDSGDEEKCYLVCQAAGVEAIHVKGPTSASLHALDRTLELLPNKVSAHEEYINFVAYLAKRSLRGRVAIVGTLNADELEMYQSTGFSYFDKELEPLIKKKESRSLRHGPRTGRTAGNH